MCIRDRCTFRIFATYACVQTEVRQEMEFIVNVYISNKVVAVRLVIFEFQCSQRILGRVRIGRVFPVRIAEACGRIYILPVAACKLVRVFVRINRTGRVCLLYTSFYRFVIADNGDIY